MLAGSHLVDRIELLVAQTPAGNTSHEIWLGEATLQMDQRLDEVYTADGQLLSVTIDPPQIVSRVMIRTTASPSDVAWREVRVFGQTATSVSPWRPTARLRPLLATGLKMPVHMADPGDGTGRLFVLEQEGRVRVVTQRGELQTAPFLDLSSRVVCCNEQGPARYQPSRLASPRSAIST
jgi:hypothetical protein